MTTVSIVVCCFADDRWSSLVAAVRSAWQQTLTPCEVVVVVDHNAGLLARARRELTDADVVENVHPRGLSGARNSGIAASHGEVVAFLDDDAVAQPDWLERLAAPYRDPRVAGVGGTIEPNWLAGRPAGFPTEFEWVVGCTYRGTPTAAAPVRNMIGANMSFRREVFERVGTFRDGIGRVGRLPTGCEETELCIRARQRLPETVFLFEPSARVAHAVPPARATWSYFCARCYAEGRSKAQVSSAAGRHDGLATERAYVQRTLPAGALRGVGDAVRGDASGIVRSAAIVAGLTATTLGYAFASLRLSVAERSAGRSLVNESVAERAARRSVVNESVAERSAGRSVVNESVDQAGVGAESRAAARPPLASRPDAGATQATPDPEAASMRFTVVIPTCGREDRLPACLDSILASSHAGFEVVVVDNAPQTGATRRLLAERRADKRIRRVAEPRRGTAAARAAGLAEAREPYVVFVDDDVIVDRGWLAAIARAFTAVPDVSAVTGLVLPRELDTPAQRWLEQFGGFGKGSRRLVFDLGEHRHPDPLYPYAPGAYGSGASMAFRTQALRELGGCDTRLSTGGEDLDLFLKVVLGGQRLVYEPAAIVWHRHPPELRSLRATMFRYGAGLAAVMTKWLLSDPRIALEIVRRLPHALRLALDPGSRKNAGKQPGYPRHLTWVERGGMLCGPFLYAAAAWRARRER
ncbi:MAG TPA: glycosyltransferase [Conexibacter sp.]|jgi:GT2 family glycosyltransferase